MTESVVYSASGGCLFGLVGFFFGFFGLFFLSLVQDTHECAHAHVYGVLGTQSPLLGVMVQMPNPSGKVVLGTHWSPPNPILCA